MKKLAILLFVAAIGQSTLAEEIGELSSMVEEQITNASNELNKLGPRISMGFGAWELESLKVRVEASVGFSLPFFITAVLVPELELVFENSETSR